VFAGPAVLGARKWWDQKKFKEGGEGWCIRGAAVPVPTVFGQMVGVENVHVLHITEGDSCISQAATVVYVTKI